MPLRTPLRTCVLAASVGAALLAVTGCSGDEDARPDPVALSPVPPASTVSVAPPAEGSAFFDALTLPPLPGELRAVGNHEDAFRTSAQFSVTVQPGRRLGVQAVCEGRSDVVVSTRPDSDAAVRFACGTDGPAQLAVENAVAETTAMTYEVDVQVPAPARWYASFYQTALPPMPPMPPRPPMPAEDEPEPSS